MNITNSGELHTSSFMASQHYNSIFENSIPKYRDNYSSIIHFFDSGHKYSAFLHISIALQFEKKVKGILLSKPVRL